jgi:LCP family protein required for cell wall assembly
MVDGVPPPAPRRRRRRRPLYRKKRFIFPAIALLIVVSIVGTAMYRTNATLSSLRQVSTLPSEVTDSTLEDGEDPNLTGGPITVQTGPAQSALDEAYKERALPRPSSDGGFGSNLFGIASGVGELSSGAAIATGLTNGNQEGLTILVMGVDARPGAPIDVGVRPDVLMVVRLDPLTQSCRALSIPRDTRVELPGYGKSKVNHALMVGGIPYQMLVTEDYLGIDIDHYMLIDFVAFEQIVDTLGGVTVDVPEDLTKNGELQFSEGVQSFDGEEALAYARFRSGPEADRARVQRQWGMMSSIADELNTGDLVGQVNQLTATVDEHLRTDLPASDIASITRVWGKNCVSADIEDVEMMSGTWVRFEDPILQRTEVYSYVEPSRVPQYVAELMGTEPDGPDPSATPGAGTPVAIDPATPAQPEPATPRATEGMPGT